MYIQDQGRWLSYRKIGEGLGLDVAEIETDNGLVKKLDDIKPNSALIYTNPGGYIVEQDMEHIYNECKADASQGEFCKA